VVILIADELPFIRGYPSDRYFSSCTQLPSGRRIVLGIKSRSKSDLPFLHQSTWARASTL
jgi:hypothetical protein